MRITPQILTKIAADTIRQRQRTDRNMLGAYMHGSALSESPLLGGTTDVDLFLIHNEDIDEWREIVRITEDVHLDIAHHPHNLYRQARELRLNPYLGPVIYNCKILYDPQHFLDFTQASVRSQFHRAENVYRRARQQLDIARQIWLSFYNEPHEPGEQEIAQYLAAVKHSANTIASLNGPPLTERRFFLNFPERANALGRPGLYAGLLGLVGGAGIDGETMRDWLASWRAAYRAIPAGNVPAKLHPHREAYYFRAFETLLGSEHAEAILWPMLSTWTLSICCLPDEAPQKADWQAACDHLRLAGAVFQERIAALDAYLDVVEEVLEIWAEERGAL
jgi:hypothetical protein